MKRAGARKEIKKLEKFQLLDDLHYIEIRARPKYSQPQRKCYAKTALIEM